MKAESKRRFGIAWKVCFTVAVGAWMFYLLSCTMNPPGNPGENSVGAYLLAFASGLLLLAAWRPLMALPLWILLFYCSIIVADVAATREEQQFVERYKTGKGPTPRQVFRSHWLAYDADTKHLSGGD